METFDQKINLEIIKTLLSILVLLITWIIGQKILSLWDKQKKRKEIDAELATEFHGVYAEYKTIIRLWHVQCTYMSEVLTDPFDKRWDLLMRATNAEARVEALLIKLATERQLSEGNCSDLGYFRQAYQQLRESIRTGRDLHHNYGSIEYNLFHKLSTAISHLISNRENKQ
jgi:hypothetical protein